MKRRDERDGLRVLYRTAPRTTIISATLMGRRGQGEIVPGLSDRRSWDIWDQGWRWIKSSDIRKIKWCEIGIEMDNQLWLPVERRNRDQLKFAK